MSALARWIVLRHLVRHPGRTLLTVAGVALGVGVFVSIRLAHHSALASFSTTIDAVAGRATLEVRAGSEGFDERLFPRLRATPGVRAAAPLVELVAPGRAGGPRPVRPVGPGQRGPWRETVMVLGVDVFSEAPFGRVERTPDARGGWLAFLADSSAAAIPRPLAERLRLGVGDTLTVLSGGRQVPLVVRRLLDGSPLDQAFGGSVAVVDIATAQQRFQRLGRLDRVALLVAPDAVAGVRDRLARELPSGVGVDRPQSRTRQVEDLIRAFALNLTALSLIALFVSTFLIFNAVSVSVVRRRGELGTLRALGLTRGGLLRLVLLEALVQGALGALLGVGFGTLLAGLTLAPVSRTLGDLYAVREAAVLHADPVTYGIGLGLGVVIALLSALAPALEAARVDPVAAVRQGAFIEARRPPIGRIALAGGGALAAGAAVAAWTTWTHHATGGFVSAFLLLTGFSLLAPAAVLGVSALARRPARALAGAPGALGARALAESVARTGVAAGALMVAVAMLVAFGIMVGSFRRTVDTWITQTIRGDLYVEPVGHRLSGSSTVMSPVLLAAIARAPGVAAIDSYRAARVALGGRDVLLVGIDFGVQAARGRLQFMRHVPVPAGDAGNETRDVLLAARATGACIVSESLARHRGVAPGDTLTLPLARGIARVPVAGVIYDYSTDAGAVFVDRARYAALTGSTRTESVALYLAPGADPERARRAVVAAAGDSVALAVIPNQALRARVLTVFDQTFQVTWALQGIALVVAVLGVVGTLTALIAQRGRDLGVLRAVGATQAQLRRMVLTESVLLGLTGALLGCGAGVVLALLLIDVINVQFFGWTIRTTLEPLRFVQAVALITGAALVAGLAPAQRAATRRIADAVRSE